MKTISGFIDKNKNVSNNVAEYLALIKTLEWLIENNLDDRVIIIRSDSKLLVNQMNGDWNIKLGLYKHYAEKALKLLEKFTNLYFKWIPREKNEIADKLSKIELKNHKIKFNIQKERTN